MKTGNDAVISRRRWLGAAATAASVGSSCSPAQPSPTTTNLLVITIPGARTYNVRDFEPGAMGPRSTPRRCKRATDTCPSDRGGTVLVSSGTYVIGTNELKSNVTLHLAASATLLGSAKGNQYHAADAIPLTGNSMLNDGNVALIFAVSGENTALRGPGRIDGQGAQFRSPLRGVQTPSGRGGSQRPYHLLFYRCKNLFVRDITLEASSFYPGHPIELCKNGRSRHSQPGEPQ